MAQDLNCDLDVLVRAALTASSMYDGFLRLIKPGRIGKMLNDTARLTILSTRMKSCCDAYLDF